MRFAFLLATALLLTWQGEHAQAHNYKKVCYFANWAYYRPGAGQYWIDKIDPFECTHLIYGFSVINNATWEMRVYDPWIDIDQGGYSRFVALKRTNPNLKTLIALGGWNDSHFSMSYSDLVASEANMDHFVAQATRFVIQYGFDGLDFDWEYPGDPGRPEDKARFVTLLRKLKAAFQPLNLMLTIAPSCSLARAAVSYDIPALATVVDQVHFMSYDIHGAWEDFVDHHAPLYRRATDASDAEVISEGLNYWLAQGFPREKLIFGIPAYGRSFTLADPSKTAVGSPASGPGLEGQYTREKSFLSLYEICQYQQQGWTTVTDPFHAIGSYAYGGSPTQWVGWDDIDQIIYKVNFAMQQNLGGIMTWELTLDDFNGFCGLGPKPVMKAIEATLSGQYFNTTPSTPPPPSPPAPKCTINGAYYADPADCNKYYRCVDGVIVSNKCPTGLAFNVDITACDYPYNVEGCY